VACTEIQFGKGVCGTVAQTQSTLIVNDVNSFPNHIACDSKSQSEIVIPIIVDGKTWGVLDIDSYSLSSFTEMDKNYLEQFVANLNSNLELNKFNFI
jgi:putative methionine-R-sulfoxide reductase with GAF domain